MAERTEILMRIVIDEDAETAAARIRDCLGAGARVEVFPATLWQEAFGSGLDDAVRLGYTKRNRKKNQTGMDHIIAQADLVDSQPEEGS